MIIYTFYEVRRESIFMTSFALKILACVSMFCDHLAYLFPNSIALYMHSFGRIAFPIFAFQLTQGYIHTKNVNKYLTRLFILALISQIPFNLYFNNFPRLNIFFTLFLGLISIHIYSKFKYKSICIISVGLIAYISTLVHTDYSWFGILLIFIFYVFKDYKFIPASLFALLTFTYYYINSNIFSFYSICLCSCTILSLIPILLYNGNQGKKVKYLFYAFYPLHLILLYFIQLILV